MPRHWMDKVWSWDHCFNTLALAAGAPELTWDQLQVVFDHQTDAGALPDSITHAEILQNFVKPPIHDWPVSRLRERLHQGLPVAELPCLYQQLTAWTNFWLDHRRVPGQPFPHYEHGNDTGWARHRTAQLAALRSRRLLARSGTGACDDPGRRRPASRRGVELADRTNGRGAPMHLPR
jgi:hypothetical protein